MCMPFFTWFFDESSDYLRLKVMKFTDSYALIIWINSHFVCVWVCIVRHHHLRILWISIIWIWIVDSWRDIDLLWPINRLLCFSTEFWNYEFTIFPYFSWLFFHSFSKWEILIENFRKIPRNWSEMRYISPENGLEHEPMLSFDQITSNWFVAVETVEFSFEIVRANRFEGAWKENGPAMSSQDIVGRCVSCRFSSSFFFFIKNGRKEINGARGRPSKKHKMKTD